MNPRGPRWYRRLKGFRSPVRAELYVPRRGPGKASPHPMAPPRDRWGTPILGRTPAPRVPAPRPDRGPTRRQRIAAIREQFPGITKANARAVDQFNRRVGSTGTDQGAS